MQPPNHPVALKLVTQAHRVRVEDGCIGGVSDPPTLLNQASGHNSVFSEVGLARKPSNLVKCCRTVCAERVREKYGAKTERRDACNQTNRGLTWVIEEPRMHFDPLGADSWQLPAVGSRHRVVVKSSRQPRQCIGIAQDRVLSEIDDNVRPWRKLCRQLAGASMSKLRSRDLDHAATVLSGQCRGLIS